MLLSTTKDLKAMAKVVVAQLVDQSLPTPEICGLSLDMGKILFTSCTILTEKREIKKKRPGMARL